MPQLEPLIIDENNIAFHPAMGSSFEVNSIGKQILKLLKENKTDNEIIEILNQEYGIDKAQLFIDVSDFLAKLKLYGLLHA
jgi:hypothetical protein